MFYAFIKDNVAQIQLFNINYIILNVRKNLKIRKIIVYKRSEDKNKIHTV